MLHSHGGDRDLVVKSLEVHTIGLRLRDRHPSSVQNREMKGGGYMFVK